MQKYIITRILSENVLIIMFGGIGMLIGLCNGNEDFAELALAALGGYLGGTYRATINGMTNNSDSK